MVLCILASTLTGISIVSTRRCHASTQQTRHNTQDNNNASQSSKHNYINQYGTGYLDINLHTPVLPPALMATASPLGSVPTRSIAEFLSWRVHAMSTSNEQASPCAPAPTKADVYRDPAAPKCQHSLAMRPALVCPPLHVGF
jgi:hypothetical protein